MLDLSPQALLHPVVAEAVDQITRIDGGVDVFRRLDGHLVDQEGRALHEEHGLSRHADVAHGDRSRCCCGTSGNRFKHTRNDPSRESSGRTTSTNRIPGFLRIWRLL